MWLFCDLASYHTITVFEIIVAFGENSRVLQNTFLTPCDLNFGLIENDLHVGVLPTNTGTPTDDQGPPGYPLAGRALIPPRRSRKTTGGSGMTQQK